MSKKKDFHEGYFDDLIGHHVHVECSSWPEDYAKATWGPDFHQKTSMGEIRQVRQHRNTGLPSFHIHFNDTRETYTKLDLDYVLKYSLDLPLKYHELKAEYIVRKAREACAPPKIAQQEAIHNSDNNSNENSSNEDENSDGETDDNLQLSKTKKRGGSTPVIIGLRKKQQANFARKQNPIVVNHEVIVEAESDEITIEQLVDNGFQVGSAGHQ